MHMSSSYVANATLCETLVILGDQSNTLCNEGRVREEIGDVMQKLKKAAAVALMVGGLGLAGGGVASAHGGHDYDEQFPAVVDNLQVVDCEQSFETGAAFTNVPAAVAVGDNTNRQDIGNFCTVIGSIDD
jgi:hypothetical protein